MPAHPVRGNGAELPPNLAASARKRLGVLEVADVIHTAQEWVYDAGKKRKRPDGIDEPPRSFV